MKQDYGEHMTQKEPERLLALAARTKERRLAIGFTTAQMALMVEALAREEGREIKLSQQSVSAFENGQPKREPAWFRYLDAALGRLETAKRAMDNSATQRADLLYAHDLVEAVVTVEKLPTYAGAGGGGTGEGDVETTVFSRSLIEYELRATAKDLLAIEIEGNSMSPDFESGDQLLVDKRKTSIAQPGAFCLWDGDGYVVKYLEKIPGSEPQKVRVISRNTVFSTGERLAEEIQILGRVVWFARRV